MAAKQKADGSWGESSEERRRPVAITGYTLIAFQAAGNLPGEGPYGRVVKKGMDYLLNQVGADGIYGNRASGQYMYAHGIATIALAGCTGRPVRRHSRAPDRTIKLIIASQNQQGGWRIVSGARCRYFCNGAASGGLRAAKIPDRVPQRTIDNAVKYVKACHHAGTGGFSYQPVLHRDLPDGGGHLFTAGLRFIR